MKLVFNTLLLTFLITSCQEEPTISLSDKYEVITEFQSIASFPSSLRESSGLEHQNGQIWTHNDGGDAPNLYRINLQNGDVVSTLNITDANNTDWEDLTEDSLYFYVADIGNNRGNRQDLNILKVLKPSTESDTSYAASKINISYADQNSFIFGKEMHDFNAEALINVDDSLFIFTKNHISQSTRCYSIPKSPNTYEVSSFRQFDTEGLITAADFDYENRVLVLLGYNNFFLGHAPFIWCFWDFEGNNFFTGKSKRFNLNFSEQTEGIAITEPGLVLISTEKEAGNGGNIWRVDLRQRVPGLW
jgi:hypothetical protein